MRESRELNGVDVFILQRLRLKGLKKMILKRVLLDIMGDAKLR